jgi:hypothetical protein
LYFLAPSLAYKVDDLLLHEWRIKERVEVELEQVVDERDGPGPLLVPVPHEVIVTGGLEKRATVL